MKEIDLTLNIMQAINNECTTGEFQTHLAELLEKVKPGLDMVR